jgi:hypothetical protein
MMKTRLVLVLSCVVALLPCRVFAIYNGTAETGFASVGAVVIHYSDESEALCAGTLVGDSWVLTAAQDFQAGCTTVFILGTDVSHPEASIAVDSVTIHPAYNSGTGANDIALLHLATPVSSATQMVLSTVAPGTLVGDDARVVGFGESDKSETSSGHKRSCTLPITSYNAGEALIEMDCSVSGCGPYLGDAGAPAIVLAAGSPRLLGFCSKITMDIDEPVDSYFISAAVYASFIADTMGATANHAPSSPQLLSPEDGLGGLGTTVSFSWNQSADSDGDKVDYRLIVCDEASFSVPVLVDVEGFEGGSAAIAGVALCSAPLLLLLCIPAASKRARAVLVVLLLGLLFSCTNPPPDGGGPLSRDASGLQSGKTYYWKVEAVDALGSSVESEVRSFTTL